MQMYKRERIYKHGGGRVWKEIKIRKDFWCKCLTPPLSLRLRYRSSVACPSRPSLKNAGSFVEINAGLPSGSASRLPQLQDLALSLAPSSPARPPPASAGVAPATRHRRRTPQPPWMLVAAPTRHCRIPCANPCPLCETEHRTLT